MKKIIFFTLLLLCTIRGNAQKTPPPPPPPPPPPASTVTKASKIGHMNSGNILALMPAVAKADTALNFYQQDLVAQGDSMARSFEQQYKVYVEAYKAGTLSAIQSQKRQEELKKQQEYLQVYAQDVEQKVANLRKALLQPIMGQLEQAIQAVAKENGYTVIFDTSTGSTLYAAEGDDISDLVKKKLNLK